VVGVVGAFINDNPSIVGTISTALEREKIAITFLNYGSSTTSTLIGVAESATQQAVVALYHALFA
jgi:aspartokinase